MNPKISIIAAISGNRALGKDNKLLWHIPEDLKRFKAVTSGHPVIMGRTTYESIGILLPGRMNIIVTRNKDYKIKGAVVCGSIEEAIEKAKQFDGKEIFIIGGGQIYNQAIKYTDKLYLTLVEGEYDADTYFPDYSEFKKLISKKAGKSGIYNYTFIELLRK
jgi:dihydrofolate reductase